MSRFNTGNPLGSGSPLDLDDNAKNFDEAINTEDPNWVDRFGRFRMPVMEQERQFVAGQAQRENEFDSAQGDREQRFNTFIASSGYQFAGDYAPGIEITEYNQVIRDENGEFWRVSGQVELPYVTTGSGMPEGGALVPAGDAVLRQDLANPDKGAAMVTWIRNAFGAVSRWVRDKLAEHVSLFDFMTEAQIADYKQVSGGVMDHTGPMLAAIDHLKLSGGGILHLPPGCLRASRLPIVSGVTWRGVYGASFIVCTDPGTLDANVPHGSFIRKPDDGQRVYRAGFEGLFIASALSGAAAAQDQYSNIIGINNCGCEGTFFKDLNFAGFGMGGLVIARAEAGAEGLGFLNTTHDGNYNTASNIRFASCGKYNEDQASLWFKFKGNSNKFYGVFGKPAETLVAFRLSNDNLISGCTAETSKNIAVFRNRATGNTVQGARAEGLSGHAYDYDDDAGGNYVFGGYYTGVSGNHTNNIENTVGNVVIDQQVTWLGAGNFPPASSPSTLHSQRVVTVRAVNGDNDKPLYVKSPKYNDPSTHPVIRLWDSKAGLAAGEAIGAIEAENGDFSAGAAGVSGSIVFVAEGSGGDTAIAFETGTGTTRQERMRIRYNGQIGLGSGTLTPTINVGTGDPEGVVSARIGSTYHRVDGGPGAAFYVKESGNSVTGWVAK